MIYGGFFIFYVSFIWASREYFVFAAFFYFDYCARSLLEVPVMPQWSKLKINKQKFRNVFISLYKYLTRRFKWKGAKIIFHHTSPDLHNDGPKARVSFRNFTRVTSDEIDMHAICYTHYVEIPPRNTALVLPWKLCTFSGPLHAVAISCKCTLRAR